MNNKPKGLGKGLSALFESKDIINSVAKKRDLSSIREVSIDNIKPNEEQPRKYFDKDIIEELAESIKALGLIQPITVREDAGGKYTIISGERRYRACKKIGIENIPVYIRKADDTEMLEMALVENVQREDLNAVEIASSLYQLITECNITQEALSKRIGKKRSTISNYIRLLRLPADVQTLLQEGKLTMGHARALLSLDNADIIVKLSYRIINDSLSVRAVELIVKNMLSEKVAKEKVVIPEYFPLLTDRLKVFMSNDVDVRRSKDGKTRITINMDSDEKVLDLLRKFENM